MESETRSRREELLAKLVDAADEILSTEGPDSLTARDVSDRVGLARNSLYRYVDSIDELRALVVAKYLPSWTAAVAESVEVATSAHDKILAYVKENLIQAKRNGHGWLMAVSRGLPRSTVTEFLHPHVALEQQLAELCQDIDPVGWSLTRDFIHSILSTSFTKIDEGEDLDLIIDRAVAAVGAILADRTRA